MAWPARSRYYASYDAMWVLPAVLLFLGLSLYPRSALSRFLGARVTVFLGEVSFAFYLVHRPLMQALDAESWANGGFLAYAGRMVLLVALITAVATACHVLWERPAQRFVNRRLRMRAPAPAPAPVPTPTP
ncbi:hypothetical protein ACFOOK_30585 [Micromonospora krabiensis]